MYCDELKMYCKSEGLSEYLRSEVKLVSHKNAPDSKDKAKRDLKIARSGLKRVV